MKSFKIKEKVNKMIELGNKKLAVAGGVLSTGLVLAENTIARAEEAATAQSALSESAKTAVSDGFATVAATVGDVLLIAVPATVGIIAITAGVKYGLKKVKGAINQAS